MEIHGGRGKGRNRHATLDGLCQHVIVRLSALIRDETLKSRNSNMSRVSSSSRSSTANAPSKSEENNDDNASNANGSPTVVTDKSGESKLITNQSNVNEAIMKLIYNDLIGDAFHHGSSHLSKHSRRPNSSSYVVRECAEHRIEKIMAVCHVLHRLLFLDKCSSLGTECVVVICSILSELYSNQYRGKIVTEGNGLQQDDDGDDSKSNASSSNSNSEKKRRSSSIKNHSVSNNKEKLQVVSSRWGNSSAASTTTYINDRHERRLQSVDVLSQQRYSGVKRSSQIIHQNDSEDNDIQKKKKKAQLPLPRIGDVLAVNLLRLLEGAAAIRLHHRQQCHVLLPQPHPSRYHRPTAFRKDGEYMLEKVTSLAATEVLTEIRSNVDNELITPLHVEDAATFYYNDKMRSSAAHRASRRGCNTSVLLQPGAKMMMRLHLFDLMHKLSMYEQV